MLRHQHRCIVFVRHRSSLLAQGGRFCSAVGNAIQLRLFLLTKHAQRLCGNAPLLHLHRSRRWVATSRLGSPRAPKLEPSQATASAAGSGTPPVPDQRAFEMHFTSLAPVSRALLALSQRGPHAACCVTVCPRTKQAPSPRRGPVLAAPPALAAAVCRQAGARVATNMHFADMDLPVPVADDRDRLPWLAALARGPARCRHHLRQSRHWLR